MKLLEINTIATRDFQLRDIITKFFDDNKSNIETQTLLKYFLLHEKNSRIEKHLKENLNKVDFEYLKDVILFDIHTGNKNNLYDGKYFYTALS